VYIRAHIDALFNGVQDKSSHSALHYSIHRSLIVVSLTLSHFSDGLRENERRNNEREKGFQIHDQIKTHRLSIQSLESHTFSSTILLKRLYPWKHTYMSIGFSHFYIPSQDPLDMREGSQNSDFLAPWSVFIMPSRFTIFFSQLCSCNTLTYCLSIDNPSQNFSWICFIIVLFFHLLWAWFIHSWERLE